MIMHKLSSWFNQLWYGDKFYACLLSPLAKIYAILQRQSALRQQKNQQNRSKIPVIVVGNLTVGGSGKTPLVLAMIQFFQNQGLRVAVVMRGYKSGKLNYPYQVQPSDQAEKIGDEACFLYQKTAAQIIIDPKRARAVATLSQQDCCDLIISDDGLQHHAMARDLEIVVIDGQRGFGNGCLLPQGPLREPLARLDTVDIIVINGPAHPKLTPILSPYQEKIFDMQLVAQAPYPLHQTIPPTTDFAAFAGIGNPQRFFATLTSLGLQFKPYIFADHYAYQAKDFEIQESCIIMTEKDAVKCAHIHTKPILVLPVEAQLSSIFWQKILQKYPKTGNI